MNLRELEVFEAIMRSGTVSAAARELGMTQSAVSRILARFEAEIGVELFVRANGRLAPSARAQAVLVQVRDVLVSVSGLRAMRSEYDHRQGDALNFVTVPSLAQALIPSVLRSYSQQFPNTRYGFDVRTTEGAVDVMTRRRAEFGIVALPVSHPALQVTPLFRSISVCVLPGGHPLASRGQITAADLKGVPLIFLLRRQPTRQLIEEAFIRAGVLPQVRVETANVATACRCVAEGLGVAVVNGLMASYANEPGLAVRPFEPRIHHTLALVEPAGVARPMAVTEFVRCLVDDVADTAERCGIAVEPIEAPIP